MRDFAMLPEECAVDVELPLALGADDATFCAGAEALEVQGQRAGSTEWQTLVPRAVQRRVRLSELDPTSAWRLRLVARNRFGESEPGAKSAPLIPGLDAAALASAPRARVAGRAVKIWLPRLSGCQAEMEWIIEVSTGAGDTLPAEDGEWVVLTVARSGEVYVAQGLDCAMGCAIRLQPVINGFGAEGRSSLTTQSAIITPTEAKAMAPDERLAPPSAPPTVWRPGSARALVLVFFPLFVALCTCGLIAAAARHLRRSLADITVGGPFSSAYRISMKEDAENADEEEGVQFSLADGGERTAFVGQRQQREPKRFYL